MNLFIIITSGIAGLYLICLSFALNTKNYRSLFVFKIVPFFTGLACLLSVIKLIGWV